MSKQPQQLVEIPVVLRLTPEAHAALVKEAADAGLTVGEKASVLLEVNLVDRSLEEVFEMFEGSLERAGSSGPEFVKAWRKGQEAMRRDSVPPEGGSGDE